MDIKIFVSHTPDRNTVCLRHPLLYHVIAGSDFQTQEIPAGVYQDNQGENISGKNKSYCELTTQYWAWKNMQADYFGFCHYRRLFSFARKSDRPVEYYDYLDEKMLQELNLDEKYMEELIGQYDFIIATGVPVEDLKANSVYEQYKNSAALYIEDVEILLQVIKEKYPKLYPASKEYFDGQMCYHCNMFIAKKELFQEYSAILFDVLEEVEKRMDPGEYSREGYRTMGHLGERMAGAFYLYLKNQKKYRLGELQRAFFSHADAEIRISKTDREEMIPIVLVADQKYVPVLYTCLQSITDQASADFFYEVYIFHTNIAQGDQRLIQEKSGSDNIHIVFVDLSKRIAGYKKQLKKYVMTETFYRFLIPDILQDYQKVVYLDCDTIICNDIAKLYRIKFGNHLLAAAWDIESAGRCNKKDSDFKKYCIEVLGLESPFSYFQAGVLVWNISEWRKTITMDCILEMADAGIYRFPVQDILNHVCKGRVKYLDLSWNLLADSNNRWKETMKFAPYYMLDAYEQARRQPYLIHYAGSVKPWLKSDGDYAYAFWKTARKTIFYEDLLKNMIQHVVKRSVLACRTDNKSENNLEVRYLKMTRMILMKVLQKESKLRKALGKVYWKVFG